MALEAEGYSVLEATDGREGVRLYREHRPALVIVDIVMPEKDGIETVCAATRRQHDVCAARHGPKGELSLSCGTMMSPSGVLLTRVRSLSR